jgi:hypothetical protein
LLGRRRVDEGTRLVAINAPLLLPLRQALSACGAISVGILYNVYCIPQSPLAVAWSEILETLTNERMVKPPYRACRPLRVLGTHVWLRPPDALMTPDETDACRQFERVDQATAHGAREADTMVAAEALATSLRREPQHFHPSSSDLGLYRVHEGHALVIGEPHPDFDPPDAAPKWRGEVFEVLWIHGKNAPLEEDFLGSPLHRVVERFWPGAVVLADEWL